MRLLNGLLRLRLMLLRIILHRSSVLRLWSGRLGGLILQTEQLAYGAEVSNDPIKLDGSAFLKYTLKANKNSMKGEKQ